jgi:RNA polymerase-binding transcription factor DksA
LTHFIKSHIFNFMTQEKIAGYKLKLEKERMRILAEIKQDEKPTDFGDDIDHGDEDSDATEALGNSLAAANDLKRRLEEIDNAIEKIHTGKFGTCEKCGKEIETEILDIDPESRLCKNCKLAV